MHALRMLPLAGLCRLHRLSRIPTTGRSRRSPYKRNRSLGRSALASTLMIAIILLDLMRRTLPHLGMTLLPCMTSKLLY